MIEKNMKIQIGRNVIWLDNEEKKEDENKE